MLVLVGLLACISFACAKHEIYDGHALFVAKIQSVDQMNYIKSMEVPLQLDTWKYAAPGGEATVLVPKKNLVEFQNNLRSNGIQFRMDVENIKKLLDEEDRLMNEAKQKTKFSTSRIGFDRIYNLTEVYAYMEDIAAKYPNVATLVNAGKSFEGRDIKYLKISTTNFQDRRKPIVFIESLLHAREWVTLPPTLYAIEKLVANVTDRDLIDSIDWMILPIANPDGYEFSHTHNRFWRKTRATGFLPGDVCMGVDLNRNFNHHWGVFSTNDVCAEDFHGSGPLSEPEARIIADIIFKYRHRIELFLDIHSFGSLILYGWASGGLPSNALLKHINAIRMAEAIDAVKAYWNPNYVVGNLALLFFEASGLVMDYAKAHGIPYSYIFELPGNRDSFAHYGFLVSPDFVYQAAMETWEAIKVGARFVRDV